MISLCKQLGKQTPQIFFAPPTYKQIPQRSYIHNKAAENLAQDLFSSGSKSYSLSSTRSKGLSLSVKKIHFSSEIQDGKIKIKNPQQMISFQSNQKYCKNNQNIKSIHNLKGRNSSFLNLSKKSSKQKSLKIEQILKKQMQNNQKEKDKLKKNQIVIQKNNFNLLIQKKLENSQVPFNIRVFQVERRKDNKNILTVEQNIQKPSSLAKKSFLRSKHDSTNKINNNYQKQQELISFCGNIKTKQQLAKKQFLESYIHKPMISSIIITTPSDQLKKKQKDPQSPVLKLKQRLQINRINNIFQKETIISKEGLQSCASIQIQESMIIEKKIRQNFIVISNKLNVFQQGFEHPYKMYLAKEANINMLISIKQCPLEHISSISQQILIYKEITSSKHQFQNVLGLYQFHLDLDKYLLIKQIYTESLSQYLQGCINQMRKDFNMQYESKIKCILKVVQDLITNLNFLGIRLKRLIELEDIVLVFEKIKIHNLSIFKIGNKNQIDTQNAIAHLQQQIMIHLNKISKGSVATSHE